MRNTTTTAAIAAGVILAAVAGTQGETRYVDVNNCPTSSCCFAGEMGCDDMPCQDLVCAAAANCCDVEWDSTCVQLAEFFCGNLCVQEGTQVDPYCSIQTAIDSAVDTDEIVVAPGTYFETINFLGKAIWLHSSDGPEVTIIDAQQSGSVVTCQGGEGPAAL